MRQFTCGGRTPAAKIQMDMQLQINGEARHFDSPLTLAGLVDRLGMKADRVAIELNQSIAARDQWATTALADGDRLEIVHFVGGGSSETTRSSSAVEGADSRSQ